MLPAGEPPEHFRRVLRAVRLAEYLAVDRDDGVRGDDGFRDCAAAREFALPYLIGFLPGKEQHRLFGGDPLRE